MLHERRYPHVVSILFAGTALLLRSTLLPPRSTHAPFLIDGLGVHNVIVKPVNFESFAQAVRRLEMCWRQFNQPPKLEG